MRKKLRAIMTSGWSNHQQLLAFQILASPKHVRDEWFAVGYRFPWEQ